MSICELYIKWPYIEVSFKKILLYSTDHSVITVYVVSFRDGVISREEMMDYFLSANTSLRESFKHNFVEHTFIATAYCEHCKGVVSKEH